jgi:hypothetical protein
MNEFTHTVLATHTYQSGRRAVTRRELVETYDGYAQFSNLAEARAWIEKADSTLYHQNYNEIGRPTYRAISINSLPPKFKAELEGRLDLRRNRRLM